MKIAIITGPRTISDSDAQLVHAVVREVIARGFSIYVGDAAGVDDQAQLGAYLAGKPPRVFSPIKSLGRTPAGLAERSTRMVREAMRAAASDELICVGFPNKPCPSEITPSKSWKSGGSGTWSTLALAVGHNIETWIFSLCQEFSGLEFSRKFFCSWQVSWRYDYLGSQYAWHFTPAAQFDFFNTVPSNALDFDEVRNGWTEMSNDALFELGESEDYEEGDPSES